MEPYVIGWVASDGHNAGSYWVISQSIDDGYVLYQRHLHPKAPGFRRGDEDGARF